MMDWGRNSFVFCQFLKSLLLEACFCSSYITVFLWIHSTTDADEMMNESA